MLECRTAPIKAVRPSPEAPQSSSFLCSSHTSVIRHGVQGSTFHRRPRHRPTRRRRYDHLSCMSLRADMLLSSCPHSPRRMPGRHQHRDQRGVLRPLPHPGRHHREPLPQPVRRRGARVPPSHLPRRHWVLACPAGARPIRVRASSLPSTPSVLIARLVCTVVEVPMVRSSSSTISSQTSTQTRALTTLSSCRSQ